MREEHFLCRYLLQKSLLKIRNHLPWWGHEALHALIDEIQLANLQYHDWFLLTFLVPALGRWGSPFLLRVLSGRGASCSFSAKIYLIRSMSLSSSSRGLLLSFCLIILFFQNFSFFVTGNLMKFYSSIAVFSLNFCLIFYANWLPTPVSLASSSSSRSSRYFLIRKTFFRCSWIYCFLLFLSSLERTADILGATYLPSVSSSVLFFCFTFIKAWGRGW